MNSTTQYGKMILARYLPYVPLEIKGWGTDFDMYNVFLKFQSAS